MHWAGLFATAAWLGSAHGAAVVALYPYTYEIRLSGTQMCMGIGPSSTVVFGACDSTGTNQGQRWQLSSEGMLVTSTVPYQCVTAWGADGSPLLLGNCDPSSLQQRWAVSGSEYPMPQLASGPLNLCAAPCKTNALQACALSPSSLPVGQCRTALGQASNGMMTARIAGGQGVTAVQTSTTSTAQVVTSTTAITQVDTSTAVVTATVGAQTVTAYTTVVAGQPTYTVVLQPKNVTQLPNPQPVGPVGFDGGLSTSSVVIITVAVAVLAALLGLAAIWVHYGRKSAHAAKVAALEGGSSLDNMLAHRHQQATTPTFRSRGLVPAGKTSILLECTHAEAEDSVVMVGDRESLGDWDPLAAPAMTRHPDNPHLFVLVVANVLDEPIEYKFAKVCGQDHTVTWMSGHNLVLQPAAADVTQAYVWEI